MTTAELVDCERRLIAAAVGRAGERTGTVDASLAERVITRAERPLTVEQAMAVRTSVSSGHGVTVIQALAGTGKTYTAGMLREVYELGVLRLTEVMRQRDPAERRALAALHDRRPQRYLDWAYNRAGRIDTFGDPAGACEEAIAEWRRASEAVGPTQAVMIARDNGTRAALNAAARELWRALGLLGEERSYGAIEIALGDRVICRRNDQMIDVDNGMRGTVRHLEAERVVIDTDSGLVRELPAAYVSEHLEHAYSLTGHGIQGATVETALVVACPRDLTAGWSYTALSRARGQTQLLIYDQQPAKERSEFAPVEQTPMVRSDLLVRVQRHMLERDDEDLAIEQLPGAGRADDAALASSRGLGAEPPQEWAAAHAEPTPPAAASAARLQELRERCEQLHAQLQALPLRELWRIESLDSESIRLLNRRERNTEELAELPEPRRRFGREKDPHARERHHLTNALDIDERALRELLTERSRLASELGDVPEVRAERDGLEHAISQATRERTAVRDELVGRELLTSGVWARDTFGECPDGARAREVWERGVRLAARYRVEHDITEPGAAIGPRPERRDERRDWERARARAATARPRCRG